MEVDSKVEEENALGGVIGAVGVVSGPLHRRHEAACLQTEGDGRFGSFYHHSHFTRFLASFSLLALRSERLQPRFPVFPLLKEAALLTVLLDDELSGAEFDAEPSGSRGNGV